MENRSFVFSALAVALATCLGVALWRSAPSAQPPAGVATATDAADYASSVSDGTVMVGYPAPEFGLAVRREQMPPSYIPACDEGFAYCLYYAGDRYAGTNFESAGVGIRRRDDLAAADRCLQTPPDGYPDLKPSVSLAAQGYSSAAFGPTGDAAAGHYASGAVYRLATAGRCYEIETRVGETQFANYEAGTIREFTDADQAALEAEQRAIIDSITLASGGAVTFPNL